MANKKFCYLLSGALATAAYPIEAQSPSVNMYGAPGLIDMPSAEMMPDAELSITTSNFGKAQKTTLTFQVIPRMTGSFRYSKIKDIGGPDKDTFDRSFDIAYQIFTPEQNGIALTVGLRDFMGTGIYAGEYIVTTTSLGDNLKLSGGAGWGRLSDSNTTHTNTTSTGGVPNADNWFQGPAGFFGGLEWQTPIERLTFKAEYSSDRYIPETGAQRGALPALFDRKSQYNFGVDYKIGQNTSLGFYYMYGSELGLKFNTNINPNRPIKSS